MMRLNGLLACFLLAAWLFGCGRADPAEDAAAGQEVAAGRFEDRGGQQTAGAYRIERQDGDLRLVLSGDFQTDEGPDLHVVLSPTAAEQAGNENAMVEGAEVVGRLGALSGEQVYDLRDDLDLARFESVLIHCIQFSHLYGAAPLP